MRALVATPPRWGKRMLLLTATVLCLGAGCAEERDPINRVQDNALAKSFFVGEDLVDPADNPEFYTQATLIDVGYGTQGYLLTSTFTMSPARIKWEITEDLLLGRLAHERIDDTDGKGLGGPTPNGQVVVAYKIVSHFDIRREYNPSTGEELNVIVENTSDRPWRERDYFRIDWSRNLNTDAYDFDTLSLLGIYSGITYSPLAYYVNDPEHEDAPHFSVEEGYFDITNKAFATPELIDLKHLGWGLDKFPACFLPNDVFGGSEPSGNCNPTEVTIRQGFRRVVDTDFEPTDWDGFRFQAYGGFYKDRFGYERNYGMSDDKWRRFLARYNIWERSHYYDDPEAMTGEQACFTPETYAAGTDPHADENQDGTEEACWMVTVKLAVAAGACTADEDPEACYFANNGEFGGSKCDTFRQACTLPYRLRQTRPLVWYYSSKSNLEFWDGTHWATHDHDVSMRHAILTTRYAECVGTADPSADPADTKAACAEKWPVYFGQMDDHLEARQLAQEVDDCRHGLSYVGAQGQADRGPLRSPEREEACTALAESVAAQRGLDAWEETDPHRVPGLVALARMPEQVVLCHSPVEADDPEACGPPEQRLPAGLTMADCQRAEAEADRETMAVCRQGRFVRIGDLRYHAVNVIEAPQSPSFWGIYSDAEDPLTGETFAASINVWSHVNDNFSQGVLDRIRYIKGELETDEITNGDYVRDWVTAADAASGGSAAPRLTREQIDHRLAGALSTNVESVRQARQQRDPALDQRIRGLRSELTGVKASVEATGHMAAIYESRRQSLLGTSVEAELTDPMMQQLGGVGELGLSESTMDFASPLRRLNPHLIKKLNNTFEAALAERGHCVLKEAPAPMSLTGMADALERKFAPEWGKLGSASKSDQYTDAQWELARAEVMRRYIANRAHYAVVVHEMGHSIGERHNFVSSSDAQNYRPQYWQLRTKNGAVTEECKTYAEDGDTCVGPRWFDPVSEEEKDNLIWMWMHSSVMDYAGEYTQDMLGLGAYDFAATRMFYGDVVAVHDDESYRLHEDRADYQFSKMDSFGGLLGYQPAFTFKPLSEPIEQRDIHYSQLQKHYELIRDCQPVNVEDWQPASWDTEKMGAWDPTLDGLIVNVDGTYSKCRQQPVDYVQWTAQRFPTMSELKDAAHTSSEPYYRGGPAIDRHERVRVPYGFATDRWADLGNAAVYRHDNGADTYEIFNFFITQQEVQHIFDNYRRGRQEFSVRGASNRTLGRYNEKIRDGAKALGLFHSWYEDLADELNLTHSSFWAYAAANYFPDQVLASAMAFDHFARMMARPESGDHLLDGDGILRSVEDDLSGSAPVLTIPNGATGYFGELTFGGKPVENRLCETSFDGFGSPDPGCGEYDADFTLNAGAYYDKAWTPYLMAESEDNFISDSRQDFVDGRYRAVSMADVFPEGYRRWLANYLTGDLSTTSLRIAATDAATPAVTEETLPNGLTAMWPTSPIGTITWWTPEPEVCFPSAGTTVCNTYNSYTNLAEAFVPLTPDATIPLDPQVGWQQQKFLIAYTMIFLPSNEKRAWLDMLRLWRLGAEADPDIEEGARIEWRYPQGDTYVARRFGTETMFGKTVERGIAARVLEYANSLMEHAYDGEWNESGTTYLPFYNESGAPIVKYDPLMQNQGASVVDNCNATDNSGCECEDNQACLRLKRYASIPFFLWDVGMKVHYKAETKGVYD